MISNIDTLKILSKFFDVSINTLLGSPRKHTCKCCGISLEDSCISKEKDDNFNEELFNILDNLNRSLFGISTVFEYSYERELEELKKILYMQNKKK